ncbi:MAG: hypothetical protein KDB65_10030 [Calditrichaeota bacterium]|nr:hypothetical protein [Calditrichota bacterium]MCB9369531.1 hypothetical protein [Calditrichota bacterium]
MLTTLMTRSRRSLPFLFSLFALFAISCSDISPVAPPVSESSEIAMGIPHTPIELQNIQLPEGYQLLSSANALDDCDSVVVSQLCRRFSFSNVLSILDLTRLVVQGRDLPHDQTITMVMPNSCQAVVDLYPSPFQFNSNVELTWLLPQVRFSDVPLNPNDIAAFYVHEDGTTELADYSWGFLNLWLTVETNHFSRYIIASRNGR